MFNFEQLELKYGPAVAYQCLGEIEKAADIPSWKFQHIDPEARLEYAMRIQDAAMRTA